MYLKNIKFALDSSVGNKHYCSHFNYHVFIVGYFLSQNIKRVKFETDGTFDSILFVAKKEGGGHSQFNFNEYSYNRDRF